MAEPENATVGVPLTNGADTAPVAGLISQYVKDFSFENPNAPGVYQSQVAPKVDVQFNIASGQVGEELYEVVLQIEVKATMDDQPAFLVDLSFAGLFGIRNVPEEQLQPFLLAEAPRILFPFARRIVADAVRDGNFPPLLLDPLDFGGLYMQQLEAQQAAAGPSAGEA